MAAPRAAPLAALLLLAALPLAASPPSADAQQAGPVLVALAAGYGPESWKDEAPLGAGAGALPLPGGVPVALGVYSNPYQVPPRPHQGPLAWLGHNLTATLELAGDAATRTLDVRLETGAGPIPAKMSRADTDRFTAQFDLDGENGQGFPAAQPGPARLVAEVVERGSDPTVSPRRVALAEFPLTIASASVDLGGLPFPEARLPGYADVGAGNVTLLAPAARPGEPLAVGASLGVPDAPATLAAWHRGQGTVLFQGRTDAQGRIAATVDPADLAGANRSGLVMLAASLDGGVAGAVGGAAVAVPVSGAEARVARFEYQARSVGSQPVAEADLLVVGVEDLGGTPERTVRGTLHAVDPSGAEVAMVPFDPSSFTPASQERVARVPALPLRESGLGSYHVVAMLLTEDGRAYAVPRALRGYAVTGGEARADPGAPGELQLRVRNFNNNFDAQADDGMALRVLVSVQGLPGGQGFSTEVNVPESGEVVLDVPFQGEAGSYPLAINTTSGELSQHLQGTATVAPAQRGLFGLPGPGAVPAALAALGAALYLRRARA